MKPISANIARRRCNCGACQRCRHRTYVQAQRLHEARQYHSAVKARADAHKYGELYAIMRRLASIPCITRLFIDHVERGVIRRAHPKPTGK